MQTTISIPTKKHHTQFAVHLFWFSVCVFVTCLGIYGTIVKFKWEYLLVLGATIFGIYYYGSHVWKYVFFKKLTIHVDINGSKVTFYGTDEIGAISVPVQKIDMTTIEGVYLLLKHQRIITYKSLEFQDVNKEKEPTEIDFLPDMYDVEREDMERILEFLKGWFP